MSNEAEFMLCNCCDRPKAQLFAKKSTLLPGIPLFLCQTCIDGKKEPRYIVILAGRERGIPAIRDYILKQRYCGDIIKATELIK